MSAPRMTPRTEPTRRPRALGTIALAALLIIATGGADTIASTSSSCSTAPPRKTVAYERISGVPADATSLDVYAPARQCLASGGKAPIVMWVHGGGYAIGDKSNKVKDKIALFSARGWIFVSVNYRLTTPGAPMSARYPDHYRDVAAAVAWTRSHIASYGGDRSRIAVLGHSAGADIVSNVTTNPRWLKERKLKLTDVRCAGPLDTEGFDKVSADGSSGEKAQWVNALGNNPNYERETSATLLIRRGAGIPRTITVYRGTPRRQAIEKNFADVLRGAGVSTSLVDARTLTHEQVNARIGARGDTTMTPPLVSFLKKCFAS